MAARVSRATAVEAVRTSLRGVRARRVARWPFERHAEALIATEPAVDLSELTGPLAFTARLDGPEQRHDWSLHATDQFALQALVHARRVRLAFEIGTFNGGTTKAIAEAMDEAVGEATGEASDGEGRVVTLDLPPDHFDRTQGPAAFTGADVGREYRASPAAHRITQLLEDSLTFDPEPWAGRCDLVLVDGAHDEEHGVADTTTAFRLVAPDGLIVWDDFTAYWHGLVRGVFEAAGERTPRRLAGTNLGVWTRSLGAR